jgi:hypothetical protein
MNAHADFNEEARGALRKAKRLIAESKQIKAECDARVLDTLDDKFSTCLAFLEDVGLFDAWVALLSYALLSRKERKWLIK